MAWDRILGDINYSLTGLEMMKINTAIQPVAMWAAHSIPAASTNWKKKSP
jgi:hypothetical protein